MNRGRWLLVAFLSLVGLVGALLVIGFAQTPAGHDDPQLELEVVREREVVFLEEHDLYVVWNGGEPLALGNDAVHLGDVVYFCRSSELFESPAHGEKFDSRGFYYGGPAARGLTRYPVFVNGGIATIDVDHPEPGPERGEGPAHEPRGRLCTGLNPWNEHEGFFDA
jgi:hypothetical protein